MPTLTTSVRALKLGDVLVDPLPTPVGGATSYVVLDLAIADPGPVGVQLARLGPIPAHLDRVATVSWPADTVLEVVRRRQPATASEAYVEHRNQVARGLLQDVERLAAGGHAAHVRLVHDEIQVSSADVHASVARALEQTRVKAWHAMADDRDQLLRERNELLALVRDGQDTVREYYPGWASRADELLERLGHE
jgi:hypothetical protein